MSKEKSGGLPLKIDNTEIDFDILPELAGHHIGRAYRALYNHFCKATTAQNVTPRQFAALVLIKANPNQTQSVIATAAGIERSTMVSLLDTLQKRGLVERNATANDRRSYALTITQKGADLIEEVKPLVLDHDRYITQTISKEELQDMVAALSKILETDR